MKTLLLVLGLLLVQVGFGQDLKETHGKTHSQILAMGFQKWYDFYTAKEGETTQGMAQASYKFAASLQWRNEKLAAKSSPALRASVQTLRKSFGEFGVSTIVIYQMFTGGGTLWQLTFSNNAMDQEWALYSVLGGKSAKPKPMVVSDVTKAIAKLENEVKTAPDSTWNENYPKKMAQENLAKIKRSWSQILLVAKKLDRRQSDVVLGYCASVLRDSKFG